jgi:hypothetical protein
LDRGSISANGSIQTRSNQGQASSVLIDGIARSPDRSIADVFSVVRLFVMIKGRADHQTASCLRAARNDRLGQAGAVMAPPRQ